MDGFGVTYRRRTSVSGANIDVSMATLDGRRPHVPKLCNVGMKQSLFFDPREIDVEHEALPIATVREHLPQRNEFEMIDHVCHLDTDDGLVVAYKDFEADSWWTSGHFPHQAIVPGILMLEGAAQCATLLWKESMDLGGKVIGFGGIEAVRFRKQVQPPVRLFFASITATMKTRAARLPVQVVVDGELAAEATILGIAL